MELSEPISSLSRSHKSATFFMSVFIGEGAMSAARFVCLGHLVLENDKGLRHFVSMMPFSRHPQLA